MKVSMQICDVCRDPSRAITTYTVTAGDRSRDTDRCDEHSHVLEAILAGEPDIPTERPARPPRRGGAPRPKIVTLEEIDALKQR